MTKKSPKRVNNSLKEFKKEMDYALFGNEKPPVGRCYFREILNLKEEVESLKKLNKRMFGEYGNILFGGCNIKGVIELIYEKLGVEEIEIIKDGEKKRMLVKQPFKLW